MSKFILFAFIFTAFFSNAQKKNQLSFYTLYDSPVKNVMPSMNDDIGIGFSYGYQPFDFIPAVLELDINHSANSYNSYSKQMPFTDGSVENYNVVYKTHLNKYLIGTKFFIGREFNIFKFFITPQIGAVGFNSSVKYPNFYKPNSDGTYPKHSKQFQHSGCSVYGAQIGLELHLNNLLKKSQKNDHRIQISVNALQSFSTLKYINLNNVNENINELASSNGDQLVFPNNEIIYNSIFSELYKTKLKMWGIHLGYVFVF